MSLVVSIREVHALIGAVADLVMTAAVAQPGLLLLGDRLEIWIHCRPGGRLHATGGWISGPAYDLLKALNDGLLPKILSEADLIHVRDDDRVKTLIRRWEQPTGHEAMDAAALLADALQRIGIPQQRITELISLEGA